MPIWILVIVGLCGYGIGQEIKMHHKHPAPIALVELDQKAAQKFADCISVASVAAMSPATLDCVPEYNK